MWALIVDGTVREVTDIDPAGRFHPLLEWRACDAAVAPGDRYVEGKFLPALTEEDAVQ